MNKNNQLLASVLMKIKERRERKWMNVLTLGWLGASLASPESRSSERSHCGQGCGITEESHAKACLGEPGSGVRRWGNRGLVGWLGSPWIRILLPGDGALGQIWKGLIAQVSDHETSGLLWVSDSKMTFFSANTPSPPPMYIVIVQVLF